MITGVLQNLSLARSSGNAAPSKSGDGDDDLSLSIVGAKEVPQVRGKGSKNQEEDETPLEDRLWPPPQFGGDMEMTTREHHDHEIYESPNVQFDDIVALEEQRLLCEAVQLPLKFPFLFSGILRPWKVFSYTALQAPVNTLAKAVES